MKTCILLITCFSYLTGIVYSNTYVWEDYDDFSGSSLDTSKWGTITFNGGIEPYHQNGSLMLSSNAQDLNAIPQNDAEWDEFVADLKQWGDPEVFAYIKDSSIHGVQASFSMPNGSADGTFVDLSFYEVDSSGQEATMTGIGIGLSQENGITKIKIETEGVVFNANPIAANISQTYTFSIINIGDTCEIFLDGVKVDEISLVNFQPNLISLSAYNENQKGYNIETDNVRVLRQATTTSLDGSIFSLSSTDGVSETMSFENGTFTSSFVDSQKITTITSNQSYILDSMSSNSWKITLNDGDVYSFDSSAGTGTLTDYENGVMDTSGSWNFTYTRNTWMDYDDFSDNSLDTTKWTATSSYFVGNQPTEANGRIELSGLTSQYSNTYLLFQDSEGIDGVEADIWLPSDAPVDTGVLIGIADAGTPVGYLDLWADSAQTHFYISLDNSSTGESVDFTRNAELGKMYKVAIIKGEQKTALYLDGEKVAEVSTWQSDGLDIIFRGVNNAGSSFTAYLDNVRVLRNWEDYDDFSSGTLDASKWDLWWGAGGALPTVVNDALQLSGSGNTNDPASSVIPKDLSHIAAERLPGMHSMALINQDDIYGIQAEFMIPSGPSDDTGLNLIFFDWAEDGSSKQEYGPELEYRSENGLRLEFAYTDPASAESMQITRTAAFDTYYKMSLIHTETTSSMYSNGELIKEFSSVGFNPDTLGFAAFNDDGLPYTTYIKNVRVLRRGTTTTQPDPVTVVSDPNGQAVVVQAGSEYQWNSALDGVTLWMVHEDDDDGWFGATIQYVSSRQQGSIGLTDQVGSNLVVNHPYVIDENGMIKVTEDTAFQYYQVTAVENGVIITADGSSFPLSDTSRFFTTRAAADAYYYSKVNPKDWMWFDHYPWVYSNEKQDWLYFYPSGSKLLYYSNKNQVWREFSQ